MSKRVRKSGYLPSLDGWRAVAILGVLMTHDRPWVVLGHGNAGWKSYGGYGVDVFFAISGVLVCTRILEEESLLGRFHIGSFYVRRLFRIQPAAIAYLTTIALLILTGIVHEHWRFWLGAFFLYQNFLYHAQSWPMIMASYFTGHFWTLALEEHFYILLSLFLFYVRRYRIPAMLMFLVVLHYAQKTAFALGYYSADTSTRRTFWMLHLLFFPAFLALLLRDKRIFAFATRFLKPWVAFGSTFLLIVAAHVRRSGFADLWSRSTLDTELGRVVYFMGFWVISTMLHRGSWSTRVLEWKPLRFVGRISYSIYVWHLLFFCTGEPDTHMIWPPLVFLGTPSMRYVSTFTVALLSYYLVEKPFIRWAYKIAPPATLGHVDLEVPNSETQVAITS